MRALSTRTLSEAEMGATVTWNSLAAPATASTMRERAAETSPSEAELMGM